jgi:hypothetical protein
MSGAYASWSTALLVGLAMLVIGIRLDLLSLPEISTRCGACGRLRRGRATCPCTRLGDD